MVWTSELELVDKVNLTVNVSGLLETSFVVESGTPLNKVDGLSPLLGGENHCVANANSVRRSVEYSSHLVSRNMNLKIGICSSVSLGSPVNKNVLLLVGDELGQLTPLYGFSFYGFILVDKNTNTIIGNSTVIEGGMTIALCHNVTVESSENNIKSSFPVEHKTRLSDDENVKRYTNSFFFIDKSTRELIQFSTKVEKDMWLLLAHQVTTSGFKSSAFFVESGQQLDTNKGLAEYFDETMFFNVTDAKNGTAYSGSTRVYENMDVVIIDLCGTFNEDECMTTNGVCTWTSGECKRTGTFKEIGMGLVIGVGVGVLAVVAGVVICVVVVVRRRKANGMVEVAMGDADLFNTGFGNNSGNKSVVTVKMDGKDTVLELVEEVGHGSFATVWKAVDGNSKKVFAVKVVDGRRSVGATEAQKEAMMMEQLDTQFVVAVFGCGFTQNTMAIAMEFFPLGSLQNVLQQDKLPSNARVPMLLDIAKAMAYLHTNGIIHRDLKPGNVLVCSIDPNLHPMSKFVSFFLSPTRE